MKKTKKKKQSMIALLREIRDKISLDTMDMNFSEMEEYFRKRREKYSVQTGASMAAEPRPKYGKK